MKRAIILNEDDIRQIVADEYKKEIYQVNIEISSLVTDYGGYGKPRIKVIINDGEDDDD